MFTANTPLSASHSFDSASFAMQINTNGGFKETDVNEFTVRPCGLPSQPVTVATAMPVAKAPQARRNSTLLTDAVCLLDKVKTLILS